MLTQRRKSAIDVFSWFTKVTLDAIVVCPRSTTACRCKRLAVQTRAVGIIANLVIAEAPDGVSVCPYHIFTIQNPRLVWRFVALFKIAPLSIGRVANACATKTVNVRGCAICHQTRVPPTACIRRCIAVQPRRLVAGRCATETGGSIVGGRGIDVGAGGRGQAVTLK